MSLIKKVHLYDIIYHLTIYLKATRYWLFNPRKNNQLKYFSVMTFIIP
jgi:hypothetical protein